MSSVLTIESVKLSSTGKSLNVKANGKTYFAKKDSGLMDKLGATIEAETELSESPSGGNPFTWITKWKIASNGAAQSAAASNQMALNAPPPSGIRMEFMPFVSNCVAHAIQSGQCEGPAAIQAWADAAYSAACNLKNAG